MLGVGQIGSAIGRIGIATPPKGGVPAGFGFMTDETGAFLTDEKAARLIGQFRADTGAPLREVFASKGITYGTSIQSDARMAKAGLADFIRETVDLYVPGIHFMPANIQPSQGVFSTTMATSFLNRVAADEKAWRLHVLLYPAKDPAWVSSYLTSGNWQQYITDHMTAIANIPGAQTATNIDVVNELMSAEFVANNGFRPYPLYNVAGPSFVPFAFQKAAELFPGIPLAYCHDASEQLARSYDKQQAVYILDALESAMTAGAPISIFNMQAHLSLARPFNAPELRWFAKKLTEDLGLSLMVGELDARSGYNATFFPSALRPEDYPSVAAFDQALADLTGAFVDTIMPFVSDQFFSWTVSDIDHSWEAPPQPEGERPCLWDVNFQPKPMYDRVRHAIVER